jgi:hypothetical protein
MDDVKLKTTVNDVVKQDGSASELIFSIPKYGRFLPLLSGRGAMEGADQDPRCASNRLSDRRRLISWLSQGSTLPAGTVIITGTPPGVGTGSKPAQFLRDGDDVRCSISHGMGAFRQSRRLLERRRLALGSSKLTRPSLCGSGTLASKISHAK